MTTRYCRSCACHVSPLRRSPVWSLALAVGGAMMIVSVLAASLIGPFIMFALPFMALFGLALGPVARLATATPRCPHCLRETPHRLPSDAPVRAAPMRRAA
jgi:hypothetical protein